MAYEPHIHRFFRLTYILNVILSNHLQAQDGRHSRPLLGVKELVLLAQRKRVHNLKTLNEKIKKLETDLYQNKPGSIAAHAKLLLLRSQYNELSANKVAASLLRLKQSYYDRGKIWKTTTDRKVY